MEIRCKKYPNRIKEDTTQVTLAFSPCERPQKFGVL